MRYAKPLVLENFPILVKDSKSNVWAVYRKEAEPRKGRFGSEGEFDDILTATTPEKELLVLPPFDSWTGATIFDGVPPASLEWEKV